LVKPGRVSLRSDRAALRSTIAAVARHLGQEQVPEMRADQADLGTELRRAVFDPLVSALGGCNWLFLAPDGNLARLPFEVLPLQAGRYLIDDYQISYLSVGRDALRFDRASTHLPAAPLVFAAPDFDLAGHALPAFTPGDPFSVLPGTCQEGAQVADLLDAELVQGDLALETAIKACRSPRVLHIATHGLFLPDAASNSEVEGAQSPPVRDRQESRLTRLVQIQNPLLRSGLALVGANTWLQGGTLPPEAEDGILTAEEVSGLDLSDTELVVLSACETGLGDIQVGEGVFGLRRAFVLAGARTLVMSLWKVPDRQTQELMVDFYQRILKGQPRADSLRAAQLAMKEKYPAPLYWGAFICQGYPGPLPQSQARTLD